MVHVFYAQFLCLKKLLSMVVHTCNFSSREARIVDPWGLLASQPSQIVGFQGKMREPALQNRMVSDEPQLGLSSGLHRHTHTTYTHLYIVMHLHTHTLTHTHTHHKCRSGHRI